jgi:nitroreductase
MSVTLTERPAVEEAGIHDLLKHRKSLRAYSEQPVESDKLHRIFEAARWAPSASNEQPWRFIVATKDNPEEHARVLSSIKEGNQTWAKHAPVLIITTAAKVRADGRENRHAFHDVGQAVAHLTVQAQEEGLYLRQMGGFDADKARELLGIPNDIEPVTAIALGYPGDPGNLPDQLRDREAAPRTRKPLSEIVFVGKWGTGLE